MDIQGIVAELRQEVSHIEQVIASLMGSGPQPARRGLPPETSQPSQATKPRHFTMSGAARARIAAAQRARWAKQKGQAGEKKASTAQEKTTGRKPMSPAMRKKLVDESTLGGQEEGVSPADMRSSLILHGVIGQSVRTVR